jgi:hypothetical protein
MKRWCCYIFATIVALLCLGVIVLIILNPVPAFGGDYGCQTKLTIAYKGMIAAIEREGLQGNSTYPLARSLNDAFGPCGWEGPIYACENAP